MAENHGFKSSTGCGSLSYSTSFSKVYPPVATPLPSDNLWADETSFREGGGVSDDVIIEVLLCPLLLQVSQPDRWLTKAFLNGCETPLVLPSCHCKGSRQNRLRLHRPKLKYSKSGVFLLINNRTEKFPALSLWTIEVAGQFVTLTIQNRILKNKLTFTSCIWAQDMDGAEFYEEKVKKSYQKKAHFSQLFFPEVKSSFICKTMHQTLLFGQRSSSTVPLTFLIACKIWGTCESFSWRGPEIQGTGADMREW